MDNIPLFSRLQLKNPEEINSSNKKIIPSSNSVLPIEASIRPYYSPVGFRIYEALEEISKISPYIKILQYVIMPDHIHVLLEITQTMDEPLGNYIARLKYDINQRAIRKNLITEGHSVFKRGFNDQFLRSSRSLDTLFNYIRTNPYRLWIRIMHPEYFQRIHSMELCGIECSLYGNLNLLSNPFKYPVIVHRRDSEAQLAAKKAEWRYAVTNGGVLTGAFIAPEEHKIFKGAAEYGGKLILINNKPFEEREKPSESLFKLCEKGQLLIISPKMNVPVSREGITRAECLFMNNFATSLCELV